MSNNQCPTCGKVGYPGAVPPEPPVGTWVKDRFGGTSYRQPAGWGEPGVMPFGKWEAMWNARGPYIICGPWGTSLPNGCANPEREGRQ